MVRALLVAAIIAAACPVSFAGEEYSARVEGTLDGVLGARCWNYTAFNTSTASKYYVYQLLVSVDFDTFVTDAEGPIGWEPYFEEQQLDHFVTWTCTDPNYFLMSGNQQGGFSVHYDREPASQIYSADFGNVLDQDERRNEVGEVILPEPVSLSAVIGLLVFGGTFVRRRFR